MSRPYTATDEQIRECREKIKAVFEDLRKTQGILARMNFSCCSGCAGCDLTNIVESRILHGKLKAEDFGGVAYWHQQDDEGFREHGKLHIRYGHVNSEHFGQIGPDTEAVGHTVRDMLADAGLDVDWDGDPCSTIIVRA